MATSAKILVVDDEPSMLRYLQTLLEVESYRVDTAPSGEAALTKLQQGVPDVVLLDVLMPGGMDGLQTLEQMRAKAAPRSSTIVCVHRRSISAKSPHSIR